MAEEKLINLPDEALPPIEELPGDLALVAEVVGVKKTMALVDKLRGTAVYFRNLDYLKRRNRNKAIRAEIDRRINKGELITKVVDELARRYVLSSMQIWNISGSTDESDRKDDRQIQMFGGN